MRLVRSSRRFHAPWAAPPSTPEAFSRYLKKGRRPEHEHFLVFRRQDDALLGAINLSEIVRDAFQSAYVGYFGSIEHAGSGYMTEGLHLVLRRAFGPLSLHRVEANIQPRNRASLRLVRRLGFRREGLSRRYLKIGGRWCDHERWAVLSEEYPGLIRVKKRGA